VDHSRPWDHAAGVPPTTKSVSVVIPSLNSPLIADAVESVLAQEGVEHLWEIIIVGLDDKHLIPECGIVRFISTTQPVSAARARNIGYRAAHGSVICFLDSDCLAMPDWLCTLVGCLEHGFGAVGGGIDIGGSDYWSACDNIVALAPFLTFARPGARRYLASLNLAAPRQVLDASCGFDESFPGAAGEDVDLSFRLRDMGYELYFEPRAVVRHCHERVSAKAVWQHLYRFGEVWPLLRKRSEGRLESSRRIKVAQRMPWLWMLVAPLAALIESSRLLIRTPGLWRYWYMVPGLLWARLAWHVGAIQGTHRIKECLWDV
jgi:cellulose synthase/poly-beta-1,6-N-acetylglucosamine synthase-like glycosyltransferase